MNIKPPLGALGVYLNAFMGKAYKIRHELAWVIFGQGMAFIGGFVGIKLLTNFMSLESYGQLALGLTIAGVMNMFLYGPIANSIMRFYSIAKEQNEFGSFFYAIKAVHWRYAGVVLLIGLPLVLVEWVWKGREWGVLVIFALLFGIVNGLNGSLSSLNGASRQRKVLALHQAADTWLRPIFAACAIYFFVNAGYVAAIGFLLATLLVGLSQYYFFTRGASTKLAINVLSSDESNRLALDRFFAYAKPFALIALFGALGTYSDKWLLVEMVGAREVGIYAAIYQIASAPISILTGMISQLMVPIIFERAGTMSNSYQIQRSSKLLFQTAIAFGLSMILVIMTAYYFGQPLIRILTTAEIAEHSQILWIIALALSMSGLAELLAVVGFKKNRPQAYILPKAIQAVSFLAMGYISVKYFGILGAAIAGCVASAVYLMMVIAVNRRILQNG